PMDFPSRIYAHVNPTLQSQGIFWELYFETDHLGQPIRTQVYPVAEDFLLSAPNVAGMQVFGDNRGCNVLIGSFQIEELGLDTSTMPPAIHRLTATFLQHCEADLTTQLQGCVHIEQ